MHETLGGCLRASLRSFQPDLLLPDRQSRMSSPAFNIKSATNSAMNAVDHSNRYLPVEFLPFLGACVMYIWNPGDIYTELNGARYICRLGLSGCTWWLKPIVQVSRGTGQFLAFVNNFNWIQVSAWHQNLVGCIYFADCNSGHSTSNNTSSFSGISRVFGSDTYSGTTGYNNNVPEYKNDGWDYYSQNRYRGENIGDGLRNWGHADLNHSSFADGRDTSVTFAEGRDFSEDENYHGF